jgi:hypothetical protein
VVTAAVAVDVAVAAADDTSNIVSDTNTADMDTDTSALLMFRLSNPMLRYSMSCSKRFPLGKWAQLPHVG